MKAFGAQGAAAIASKKRGRPSNRRLPLALREQALALVRERYADFGPKLAHEKLVELHNVILLVPVRGDGHALHCGWLDAAKMTSQLKTWEAVKRKQSCTTTLPGRSALP